MSVKYFNPGEDTCAYVKGRSLLFLETFIQLCAYPPPTPPIFHFFPLCTPTVNCWLIHRSLLKGKNFLKSRVMSVGMSNFGASHKTGGKSMKSSATSWKNACSKFLGGFDFICCAKRLAECVNGLSKLTWFLDGHSECVEIVQRFS